jgi:hypothetical protein
MRTSIALLLAAAAAACAAEGAPPIAPHHLRADAGRAFAWTTHFTGMPTAYRAEGLPPGLVVDPRSGAVGGVPTTPGTWTAAVYARNAKGEGVSRLVIEVVGGAAPPPPPPPAASGGEEEDTPDPALTQKVKQFDWTDMQRRTVINCLLPGAASLGGRQWYYRVSHVAAETYDGDLRTNLLGLDDSVKIGIAVAYGLTDSIDLTLQRVNGYNLSLAPRSSSEPAKFDYYDLLAKWKFADQRGSDGSDGGFADISLIAGVTYMLRNTGSSDMSLDAAVIAERDLFNDRFRLGIGIAHAGLSTYEATPDHGPGRKILPAEYDYLSSQGAQPAHKDPPSTTSIPVTCKVALSRRVALLGEAIFPIDGYETGEGPSLAAGLRLNTSTHEFSFYLTNTANVAFNGVLTGGNSRNDVNLFAFSISSYF